MIVKCLPVNEILDCKLVNKQFYSVIKALKLRKLVITDHNFRSRHFHSNEPVDYGHRVKINSFRLFEPILAEQIFTNLKSLLIDLTRVCMEIESSESINRFRRLERLEVDGLTLKNVQRFALNLPLLRTLSIRNLDHLYGTIQPNRRGCTIAIDSPKLTNLRIEIQKTCQIEFVLSESVKFLEISDWQQFVYELTELEYLYCRRIKSLTNVNDFLCKFEKLKELHMDAEQQVFEQMVEQKRRLKRMHPKIFVIGVHFEHRAPENFQWQDEVELDEEWMAAFYWEHRDKVASILPFIRVFDYGILEMHFGNRIPSEFGHKFTGLYQLKVTSVRWANQFVQFLSDCRFIRNLYLDAAELDQHFFNTLPTLCPTLEALTIFDQPGLDYNFLFKFRSLVTVTVANELPTEFAKRLIEHFPELEMFMFNHRSTEVSVCICAKDHLVLYLGDDAPIKFKAPNELFDHLVSRNGQT